MGYFVTTIVSSSKPPSQCLFRVGVEGGGWQAAAKQRVGSVQGRVGDVVRKSSLSLLCLEKLSFTCVRTAQLVSRLDLLVVMN